MESLKLFDHNHDWDCRSRDMKSATLENQEQIRSKERSIVIYLLMSIYWDSYSCIASTSAVADVSTSQLGAKWSPEMHIVTSPEPAPPAFWAGLATRSWYSIFDTQFLLEYSRVQNPWNCEIAVKSPGKHSISTRVLLDTRVPGVRVLITREYPRFRSSS
jgi:hypothetical protein